MPKYFLISLQMGRTDGPDGTHGRTDWPDGTDGRNTVFRGFLARIFGIRPERGRDGRTGRTDGIQFYSTTGTEKYSVTVLPTIRLFSF